MLQDKAFLADRTDMSGRPFDPEAMANIRAQTVIKMPTLVQLVQSQFLGDGRKFLRGGDAPSKADMHLS